MSVIRMADGKTGDVAIFMGGAGDAPFYTPEAHLDKIRFHSRLPQPAVVATLSGTLSLPAIPINTDNGLMTIVDTNCGAHGQAGPPLVFGDITIGGQRISICGMVPVTNILWGTAYAQYYLGFGRFLELCVDNTNVFIRATNLLASRFVPGAAVMEAFSGAYQIYVTHVNLNNPSPKPPPTPYTLLEEPNLVQYGRGMFRSDMKFLRAAAGPTAIKFAKGKTYEFVVHRESSSGRAIQWAFTWNVANWTMRMGEFRYWSNGSWINGPIFTAAVQDAQV